MLASRPAIYAAVVGDASEFLRWMPEHEAPRSALAANRAARDAWTARVFAMTLRSEDDLI